MVQTLCKVCAEPQGITHALSAFWTAAKQDGALPDLITVRTTVLDVYTVLRHGSEEQQASHRPSHTLQLEASHTLHGEVRTMVCLSSRRAGHRDSLVLVFDAVRFSRKSAVFAFAVRRLSCMAQEGGQKYRLARHGSVWPSACHPLLSRQFAICPVTDLSTARAAQKRLARCYVSLTLAPPGRCSNAQAQATAAWHARGLHPCLAHACRGRSQSSAGTRAA